MYEQGEWLGQTPFLACHNSLICNPWSSYLFHSPSVLGSDHEHNVLEPQSASTNPNGTKHKDNHQ